MTVLQAIPLDGIAAALARFKGKRNNNIARSVGAAEDQRAGLDRLLNSLIESARIVTAAHGQSSSPFLGCLDR
jgi:hypothetical protein